MADKIKIKFDASSAREAGCKLRFKRTVIDGISNWSNNNDTQYGSAVHRFIYIMHCSDADFALALREAKTLFARPCNVKSNKQYLTPNHLAKTCLDYWEGFAIKDDFELLQNPEAECFMCEGDGSITTRLKEDKEVATITVCRWCEGKGKRLQPMVEVNFEIVLYEDEFYIISITGTIDKLGQIMGGCYAIGDNKATASFKVKEFLEQFYLSNQLRIYHWVIHKLGNLYPESVFNKMARTPVGAFIDGIFYSPKGDVHVERSEVFQFTMDEVQEIDNQIMGCVKDLLFLLETPEYNVRDGIIHGQCHNGYGFCKYYTLCAAPDDIARGHIIKNDYKIKPYNPLMFGKD